MFKVGDIVCLTNGDAPMRTFTEWAQKMMKNKDRCRVVHTDRRRTDVEVLEGKSKGKTFGSTNDRFKKLGIDVLEVEEL